MSDQDDHIEQRSGSFSLDPVLGYIPAIPLPFYGRMKWWHIRTNFVCGWCHEGFNKEAQYRNHYALTHIGASHE